MKAMIKTFILLLISFSFVACSEKALFDENIGNIHLAIDGSGKITVLQDLAHGINYIAPDKPSYLIGCKKYGIDSIQMILYPHSMRIAEKTNSYTKLELAFSEEVKLTVNIRPVKSHFRMEVTGAEPLGEISMISWGPYYTNMKGQIGEWIGLNRSNDFAIGLLTLAPNTDGTAAAYTQNGSMIQLLSYDNTHGRFIGKTNEKLRKSVPLPGVTVVGSAVALFGCAAGKDSELDAISKIELDEGLPHPLFEGKWNKLSEEGQKFCLWANYTEKDMNEHLRLSKDMGARILCRPGGFFRNWGHFEIDPQIYPGGTKAILNDSRKAKKEGIGLTLYTLATFLKPNPDPEPYLTPVPDERLQTWAAQSELINRIDSDDMEIGLQNNSDVAATLEISTNKVIRIDNELIEFKYFVVSDNKIVAGGCERGAFNTIASCHLGKSKVRLMYVSGYHNFYPGTLDLTSELSERLSKMILETDVQNFVVDGFESCQEVGYGDYTGNIFLKNIYDRCVEKNKELLVTGSGFSAYSWHIVSHISWGEGDQERGFRGTMLDYRLYRQLQLRRNLMPHKLGQYYPDNATAEDIEWLMGLMTGWDSGVDFHLNLKSFRQNPEYSGIIEIFNLWDQARKEKVFTEQQKLELRQTDVLFKLSRGKNGAWNLKFERFWQNDKIKILPSSTMNARPVGNNPETLRPCSIDWKWTHNPGLYDEVGLSDDLVHCTGEKETTWTVDFPFYSESKKSWFPTTERNFQFIIRLLENAPCSVSNFIIKVDNQVLEIPVILQPGQYISIPHTMELACIYNKDHHISGEVFLHGNLPKVKTGKTSTVSLSCSPADPQAKPEVIMNARFQNGYFHML